MKISVTLKINIGYNVEDLDSAALPTQLYVRVFNNTRRTFV